MPRPSPRASSGLVVTPYSAPSPPVAKITARARNSTSLASVPEPVRAKMPVTRPSSIASSIAVERRAIADEVADAVGGFPRHQIHNLGIAQAGARRHGIGGMVLPAV